MHKIAIIGLGIMGRRMLENVALHPAFELSGAWDPSPASTARTLEMMPGVPVAASAEAAMRGSGRATGRPGA